MLFLLGIIQSSLHTAVEEGVFVCLFEGFVCNAYGVFLCVLSIYLFIYLAIYICLSIHIIIFSLFSKVLHSVSDISSQCLASVFVLGNC